MSLSVFSPARLRSAASSACGRFGSDTPRAWKRRAVAAMIVLTGWTAVATIGMQTASAADTMPGMSGMHGMTSMKSMASSPESTTSPGPAHAAVQVSEGWVRWLPGKLPAAAYMTLENTANAAVDLIGADSPDYRSVMLHRSVNNGATSTMMMADKVALPPHHSLAIAPGDYHFMLSDATHPIAPGSTVQMTLHFSNGSQLTTRLPVSPPTRMH